MECSKGGNIYAPGNDLPCNRPGLRNGGFFPLDGLFFDRDRLVFEDHVELIDVSRALSSALFALGACWTSFVALDRSDDV